MTDKKKPAMYDWVREHVPDHQTVLAIGLLSMLKTQIEFGLPSGLAMLEELNDAHQ